jgi:hypothetical protein
MASGERITDNRSRLRDPRKLHGRGQPDEPAQEAPLVPEVPATRSSGGPVPLYFPACGALCDILWWAPRKT